MKEATILKASPLKNAHTFSLPVEYWQAYTGRWTNEATLTISKSKTKLHLDFKGFHQIFADPTRDNQCQGQNQRITFFLYNLVVEHSDPIARNFLAILSGGGQILRHRIAFYSEADGNFAVVLFKKLGAQIIVRRLISQPFQIQNFAPKPWSVPRSKKILAENERDVLNERVSRLRRESVAIGEDIAQNNRIGNRREGSNASMYFL